MKQSIFRKLNIDLPREPVTDDRPWSVAGWLVAIAFVVIVAYAFLKYKEIF